MNRREASRLLSQVREGLAVDPLDVLAALHATGDLGSIEKRKELECPPTTARPCSGTLDTIPSGAQLPKGKPS